MTKYANQNMRRKKRRYYNLEERKKERKKVLMDANQLFQGRNIKM